MAYLCGLSSQSRFLIPILLSQHNADHWICDIICKSPCSGFNGDPVAPMLTGLASEVTGRTDGSGFQCAHWIFNWILRLVWVNRIETIHDFEFFCSYSSFDESRPNVRVLTQTYVRLMNKKLDQKLKVIRPAKIFCATHNFFPWWDFDKLIFAC